MAEAAKVKTEKTVIKPKTKVKRTHVAFGAAALLSLFVWWGLQPLTAGIEYGICRTYAENKIKYPTTFKITQYDTFGASIRLFFTHIDEYGGQRSEMIECIVQPDPDHGYVARKININRKPISDEDLARFNQTIPGIVKGKPNLVIPKPNKEGLIGLRAD